MGREFSDVNVLFKCTFALGRLSPLETHRGIDTQILLPKVSTLLFFLPVKETLKGSLTGVKMEGCPCFLPSNTLQSLD